MTKHAEGLHILFLSDNFPPETNAPATRLFEHARVWVKRGARVRVITCAPNFPHGRVFGGYQNRWFQKETIEGIEVLRVKTYMSANSGFLLRTLDQLSFMLSASVAGFLIERPDVVVATSPQFFCSLAGWIVALFKRRPFVFELRDLWPASIAAVGAMRPGLVLRALEKLELFLYRRAKRIVALTAAFRRDLVERGISEEKIEVVTNGVDLTLYRPHATDKAWAERLGLEQRFVVGYIGTHGMAHGLEHVLEAAELLRDHPRIRFLFAGAGAEREPLMARARERGLENVVFLPAQPKARVAALWGLCDVALIHLRDTPVFQTVIPSKLFEAMGMGLATLLSVPDGEATEIARRADCGPIVEPERPQALAEAVRLLAEDEQRLQRYARNSRAAAGEYDRTRLAERMLDILERTARPRPRPSARTGSTADAA